VKIGIIGAGWVGVALIERMLASSDELKTSIVATGQSQEKVAYLQSLGVQAEKISFPISKESTDDVKVFESDILIILIPPQFKQGKADYPDKIKQIVRMAKKGNVQRIILTSSTAVYGGLLGEVNEFSSLNFEAEKVALLKEAEDAVLGFSSDSVVVRLGGLVGPKRHPGRFIHPSRMIKQADSYVNLIHQYDVVSLILSVIEERKSNGIYNGVADYKIIKRDFYQAAAKSLNMPQPSFEDDGKSENRRVISERVHDLQNYKPIYENLLNWLEGH